MTIDWDEVEDPGGKGEEGDFPETRMFGGIPWAGTMGPYGPTYQPVPTGYATTPYQQMLERFQGTLGGLPMLGGALGSWAQGVGSRIGQANPSLFTPQPLYNYPGAGGGGGGGALRYDPFSQEMEGANLQEMIRQFNISQAMERAGYGIDRGQLGVNIGQLGLERGKFLTDVLSTPANVFSSFFSSRGQVPPYNAQLANILNVQGQGQPFFGSMPPMPTLPPQPQFPPLGQTPGIPAIPQPQPPQAIPYAQGGTYIPAEPAVAIGLQSGQPLFTFNEQAPAKTEKIKITPQKKVPSFQQGGTAHTYVPPPPDSGVPDYAKGYNPYSGWEGAPGMEWIDRGTGAIPSSPGIRPEFSAYPAPLGDAFSRGFPQFPFLQNLGMGQGLGAPQMGQALHGFPLPSPQALNRMTPSEGKTMMNMFDVAFGVPGEDVLWASMLPFQNLRGGIPAMQRIGG